MIDYRYSRQEILPGVGEQGQKKLFSSRVLVVGAGGLGCPALLYLAGAGVGTIGVCDGDRVDITNLQRQVLFTEESVGRNKAAEAVRLLAERNSQIRYEFSEQFVTAVDFSFLGRRWDVVIDATDRIETRYLIDDVCRLLDIPLIHASVSGDEIQVAIFASDMDNPQVRICYRDLYPQAPGSDTISTCSQDGILGPVPGVAGLIQARECLGLLLGIKSELKGNLLWMDATRYQQRIISIKSDRNGFLCWPQSLDEVGIYDYDAMCSTILSEQLTDHGWLKALDSGALLVDVREVHEQPRLADCKIVSIPFSELIESFRLMEAYDSIVVFCQSGKRGERAAQQLRERWSEKRIFNIPGGINTLVEKIASPKTESK